LAINLNIAPDEVKASATNCDNLIVRGGKVWMPNETTMHDQGLPDAWKGD